MAFDQDKFRQLAKEQGYSDDEINSHLGKLSAATGKPFGQASEEMADKTTEELKQAGHSMPKTESATPTTLEKMFGFASSPIGTAAIGAAGLGAGAAIKKGIQARKTEIPVAEKIEPTFALEPAQQTDKLKQLSERVEAGRQAGLGTAPVQPPVAAAPVQPPVQPVAAPVETPAIPSAAEAVATGQSPSKAVQMDVAQQLDEASGVAGRVRRTKAQIEQAMQEAFAKAPEGMLPSAPAKTNKWPGDVIGQGGWHWFEGQGGTPEEWTRLYGRTNQPYQRVVTDVKGGVLGVPPKPEGAKGGTVPRQEHVPEYIKGAASPAMLLNVAANALGVAGLANAYKEGKNTGDWSNLGLGVIDQILSNVAPKAGLATSLMAPRTLNTGEQEELAKRRKMKPTVD